MSHDLTRPDEFDYILAKMKFHQRRDVLLCIDEILTSLDTASPAADQWKAARRYIRLGERKKFAAMMGAPAGAAYGLPET